MTELPPGPGGAIRAVVLDLDDTLLDHRGAASEAVLAFAAAHGLRGPADDLLAAWHHLTDVHYARYQRRELSHLEHRRVRIRAFTGRADATDAEADRLFGDYQRRYAAGWRAYDDALPALQRCRRAGLAVAVLTNGETDIQTSKLRTTGLLPAVDLVAASSALPAAKPDARAFVTVADRLGVGVGEAVMVGDSVTNDVRGALGAGMRAVLVDRHDAGAPPDLAHVPRLRDLTALPEALPGGPTG